MTVEENWYALRTYFSQESKVGAHLDNYQLTWFIPMHGKTKRTKSGNEPQDKAQQSKPFVHNLIFIKQPDDVSLLKRALSECPYSTWVYRQPNGVDWCVIPGRDILELRIICDQSFTEPIFLTGQEAELKVGREVKVAHGPLSGIQGLLVRKNKKYYVLKMMVCGMGVMVAVSRWCCVPLDKDD